MSDEAKEPEEPTFSFSVSPLLRRNEEGLRDSNEIRDAVRAAEELNRTATPLRIGTATEEEALIARHRDRMTGIAGEDLAAGDIVTLEQPQELTARIFDAAWRYRVGIAGEDLAAGNIVRSVARPLIGSYAVYASMAYMPQMGVDWGQTRGGGQYQYNERFPKEVTEKAWKLLEQYMTPEQYFAFMEKAEIELENMAGDFRLIINRSGKFTILEGARGSGIVAQSGNVRSYKYPLGDEIAAFIDWFNHRTKELIAQWGCGTYGIVRK